MLKGGRRFAVVGGGIVGAAVARRLLQVRPDAQVTLLEKENALAQHQTGHNSGVVHAGLYYAPGSLKARLCRHGVSMLREYCGEHGITYEECGKVLVALDDAEQRRLRAIHERALANQVPAIRMVGPGELREIEPHVRGVAGLHSPHTAIVDYAAVTRCLAADAHTAGADVRTGFEVVGLQARSGEVVVHGSDGSAAFDQVVVCAGLPADRVAALAGGDADPRIIPFRGVHLTRRVDGQVMVGPNAVLALAREGYGWASVSALDLRDVVAWPGFRRFARQHWRTGAAELVGSLSRHAFVAAARRYVPDLRTGDVVPGPAGVRAQAMGRDGVLVDDFRVTRRGRVLSVRNAPSPAATSSLAIAEQIVDLALDRKETIT